MAVYDTRHEILTRYVDDTVGILNISWLANSGDFSVAHTNRDFFFNPVSRYDTSIIEPTI
jgi:hypothetical protein